MVLKYALVCLSLVITVAGCVAPEAPPEPRATAPAARPAASTANYEDAPLPNRKMGTPGTDSIIRVAH